MPFQPGQPVKVDQGFGQATEGVVVSFDNTQRNVCGFVGNYVIRVTGGVDCFGRPAKVGAEIKVHQDHVIRKAGSLADAGKTRL